MIFACIASELFAYRARFINDIPTNNLLEGNSIQVNFDNFPNSFLNMMTLLLNEAWEAIMYNYMRAVSRYASIFWVIIVSIATFLIMRLFLAIFLNNFLTAIKDENVLFTEPKSDGNIDNKFANNDLNVIIE